jgi:hypothetical protein
VFPGAARKICRIMFAMPVFWWCRPGLGRHLGLRLLTSGIPVVISNLAMIADEITATGGALAFDPHDQIRFGEILSRLASDDRLIASMSVFAHSRARSMTLTPVEWTARLLDIYDDVLRRSHTGGTQTESQICNMARG